MSPEELIGNQAKRCRVGDLHSASVPGEEVAEERAQQQTPDLKERWDSTRASAVEGEGAAIPARIAEGSIRALGHELRGGGEEKSCWDLASAATERELNTWEEFKVFQAAKGCAPSKCIVDARRALTWKMVDGDKDVEARLPARGRQGPNLNYGSVETFGRVRLRSSRPQVNSLCAIKKWNFWVLGVKDALSQVDGSCRIVFSRAPVEWNPGGANRCWKLRSLASGLNDAPGASQRTLRQFSL